MSIEIIFGQLRDRAGWPEPPMRIRLPAGAADLRVLSQAELQAAIIDPAELRPWTPGEDDAD